MSVASSNPFAILQDDAASVSEPDLVSGSSQPQNATATPAGDRRRSERDNTGRNAPSSDRPPRGNRSDYRNREGREENAEARARGEYNSDRPSRGRGGGRGRGDRGRGDRGRGDRGRGRGGSYNRGQNAESDPAPTNVEGPSDNFGAAEAPAAETGNDDASGWYTEPAGADSPAPIASAETPAAEADRREDEEEKDNTMTLEQYLQQKKDALPVVKPDARRANDGDDSLWKDVVQISKESDDNYFIGKTKAEKKPRAKKEEKVFLDIEPAFQPRPNRGGRGRGDGPGRGRGFGDGAGRGRGGGESRGRGFGNGASRGGERRGRGGARNDSNGAQIDVGDQNAFPSL